MNPTFKDIFYQLVGVWSLEREISTGEILKGKAVFERVSDTAFLLREEGVLTLLNGSQIKAERNWYWHFSNDSNLEITYDEKRMQGYHVLNLKYDGMSWDDTASHLCGADVYTGYYSFLPNSFEISQTIKGPNKDYSVKSRYSK